MAKSSVKATAIRRARKFEDVARYYYDHGDLAQGDQYQARANQYWRDGGKPQMIKALQGSSAANPVQYDYSERTGRYERVSPPVPPVGRIDFHRIPLNQGGYDRRGEYFGQGAPLYEWYDEESQRSYFTRASSRAQAKTYFENVRRHLVEYGGHGWWGQKNPGKGNPMRTYQGNPISDGQKIAIGAAAVAVLGLVGYFIYQQTSSSSSQAAAGSGGGTISSGQQPYQLGTSTSTSMPAASAQGTIDYSTSTAYAPGYSAANPPPPAAVNLGDV
jgi:hypothetical protein